MDFWINAGIAALLEIIKDKKQRPKWFAAIAKVYVTIQRTAAVDDGLKRMIEDKGGTV